MGSRVGVGALQVPQVAGQACCPPEIVGGFAVACARRGREQGEREPGEHLLVGFW